MMLCSTRVPWASCADGAMRCGQVLTIELGQIDHQEILGLGQVQVTPDDRVVMHDPAILDHDLDAVGDLVLVAHGGPRRAADGVEDARVEDIEAAALQLCRGEARLLDHAR